MRTRRGWAALLRVLTGCSTSPVVDTLDFFKPGRLYPTRTPYGGVCIPQGPGPIATTPSAPVVPPAPLIPPPALLPPSGAPITVPNLPPPPGSVVPVPAAPPPSFPTAP